MSTTSDRGLNYFISGSSRGIGYQLVTAILDRQPNATIFAGTRNPTSATALKAIASKHANVHIVKLVPENEESHKAAIGQIRKITDRLDVVVANAGFDFNTRDSHRLDTTAYKQQFEISTLAPLFLYRATHSLLIAPRETDPALSRPKFLITPSRLGSLAADAADTSYRISEAAVEYLALWIQDQTEHVGAIVVAYNPGAVLADIFNESEAAFIKVLHDDSSDEGSEYADSIMKPAASEYVEKYSRVGVVPSKNLQRRRNGWPRCVARAACGKLRRLRNEEPLGYGFAVVKVRGEIISARDSLQRCALPIDI